MEVLPKGCTCHEYLTLAQKREYDAFWRLERKNRKECEA